MFFRSCLAACLLFVCSHAADLSGYFLTHVGDSGRQSVVEFFEKDGLYYAYGFANVNGSAPRKDVNNPDPNLKERLDKGAVFVFDLKKKGKQYENGMVYNFDNGKYYYLKVSFKDENILELRASIDKMGMFGETLTWKRLSASDEEKYLPQKPDFSVVESSLQALKKALGDSK